MGVTFLILIKTAFPRPDAGGARTDMEKSLYYIHRTAKPALLRARAYYAVVAKLRRLYFVEQAARWDKVFLKTINIDSYVEFILFD